MFAHKTPSLVQRLFPKLLWKEQANSQRLYLTFDDGPVPEATPMVLDHLKKYQAKATFFCVGDNIRKHPHLFSQVVAGGHSVGNHTHNHLDGWKCSTPQYVDNIRQCQELIRQHSGQAMSRKPLFRPPYGRLNFKQIKAILPDYRIVMWDVLSGDFSVALKWEKCLRKSIQHTKGGSIVLFHDSNKTLEKLDLVLPSFLEYFSERGYTFDCL